ncbi:MAG: hypothetical protein AAGD07_12805 [Planctomycetota bacterium]
MKSLHEILAPLQRRLWMASIIRGSTLGFLMGVAGALMLAIARLFDASDIPWWMPAVVAVSGAVLGFLYGCVEPGRADAAARLLDHHFQTKDRSVTWLQFAGSAEPTELQRLQMEEAEQHLQSLNLNECVSLKTPPTPMRWASGLAVLTALVMAMGVWMAPKAEAKVVLDLAQQQSVELRQTLLPELEELVDEDPELEKLVEELEEKVDEMERETIDEADLLAKLSEMEQSLAEARDAMQMELTDEMMKALAAAMKPSDAMKNAASAMEAGDYDKASEKLEAIDPSKLGDKERRAVADNLKKMLSKLKPGQQGQLSDSIGELAEGLESKNSSQCKQCLSKLASACKKQGNCKKIGNCMMCQLNRLAQCKSECRGQCLSNKVAKSNRPSTKAGMGASGKPFGDEATRLNSTRKQEELTGVQGEGPSETEIMQAPEGEQEAFRKYATKYDQFRREAEAVLNSEPLPMGHRETVRTYFEAIRPDSSDSVNASTP